MKRKISVLICLLFVFTILFSGCAKDNNVTTQTEEPTNTENEFRGEITFNGSSTLAPVIAKIATEFTEEYTTWDKVDSSFPNKSIAIYVASGGSGAGIKSVIEGTSDFGMSARNVKEEEKQEIGDYKEFLVGVDALTIAVNPENPIHTLMESIPTEEVKKIFSGEYKFWNEVHEELPNTEIVVVIRDLGGGAHEVFQKSVMGDTDVREDAIQSPSMGALVTKIIENKNTIGYASFGSVNQNKGKLIPLKVDDVEATEETIVSGAYKISRPLIVARKGDLTPQQQIFMEYLLSKESANIVDQMGFVPAQ